MSQKQVVVAIDIGTTKVCTVISEKFDSSYHILGVGSHPSHGLKKGSVVNIEKTVDSIRASLEEAKLMAGIHHLDTATIGIAGNHIYCFNSSGVVPVKNAEIQVEDVQRAMEAARAVLIPSDREVIHIIAQEYKVDSTSGIKNPIGMRGSRLEVKVHIVTGKTPLIQNLLKCVELSGLKVHEMVLQPLASSSSVLSLEEKDLGVVLLDIGGGTTDMAVWKEGSLIHSQIIPIGGGHFTNDLAVALKISHNEAERIKILHGSVVNNNLSEEHISIQGLSGVRPREVSLTQISQVVSARAEELFRVVSDILVEQDLQQEITGGFVLTGGGSLIKHLAEFGEYVWEKPVKIGHPHGWGGMTSAMQNPKFATVLGLLQESKNSSMVNFMTEESHRENKDFIGKIGKSIKSVFKELF